MKYFTPCSSHTATLHIRCRVIGELPTARILVRLPVSILTLENVAFSFRAREHYNEIVNGNKHPITTCYDLTGDGDKSSDTFG